MHRTPGRTAKGARLAGGRSSGAGAGAGVSARALALALTLGCAALGGVALAEPSRPAEMRAARAPAIDRTTPAAAKSELPAGELRIKQGRFGELAIYRPPGKPTSVALFISGDGGWTLGVVDMARQLASRGAVVVGIDVRRYRAEINANGSQCQYLAGEFEYLSHFVQKTLGLDEYHVPVLVGYSSGATLAYAVMVQSPKGTYSGALSLGFCPEADFTRPLCRGSGLEYDTLRAPGAGASARPTGLLFHAFRSNSTPWIVVHGDVDDVCRPEPVGGFVAATGRAELVSLPHVGHGFSVEKNWMPQFLDAYARLADPATSRSDGGVGASGAGTAPANGVAGPPSATAASGSAPPPVDDLPLVAIAAKGPPEAAFADTFVVLLTGDGGWAGIDQDVSTGFSSRGIPVVALNSLKYFWKERTPDAAARDLDRIVARYSRTWQRNRVLLVGYSFGADVLPFLFTRLPAATAARVRSVSLLGLSDAADFEFHVADWLPGAGGRHPTVPEVAKLDVATLCIHGAGESDSVCPRLHGPRVTTATIGDGHHFGGDADGLVRRILATARTP